MNSTATTPRHKLTTGASRHLYRLKAGEIWRFLKTQSASMWFLCVYMFFEYIRPQALRSYLDFLPWAQTFLLLSLAACILEGRLFRVKSPVTIWLIAFTGVVMLSIWAAAFPEVAMKNLDVYFIWVLVYFLIINVITSEKRFLVFLLAFILYHFYMAFGAVRQWASIGFRFRSWGLPGGAGWFANSGDFGVALCIFTPLAFYFMLAVRPYVTRRTSWILAAMPVSGFLAIIGSSSRGAVVGLIGIGFWMLARTKYRVKGTIAALAVVAIGYLILPAEQKARFTEAGEDYTSVSRLTYWKDGMRIAAENPLHGIGYFGWIRYYGQNFPRTRKDGYILSPELPHNMFVLAAAELGYPGLLLLLVLMGMYFVVNGRTRRLAARDPAAGRFHWLIAWGFDGSLVGLIVSGFFDTVTWYPFFWVLLAMTVALHEVVRRKDAVLTRAVHGTPAAVLGRRVTA